MYLTPADLIARFGAEEVAQLSDRTIPRVVSGDLLEAAAAGGDAEIAEARAALAIVDRSLVDAQSEVDSYLSSRYTVPLDPAPAVIARYTGDVARYILHEDHATEEVRKRYEDALVFLRAVASGKAVVVEQTGAEPTTSGGLVEMTSARPLFNSHRRRADAAAS